MNLEAESGHYLCGPFFLISIGNEIVLRNLLFSTVLSYAVSFMVSAYSGQSVHFWESEGSPVVCVSSGTNKGAHFSLQLS